MNKHRLITITVPSSTADRLIHLAYSGIRQEVYEGGSLSHHGRQALKANLPRTIPPTTRAGAVPIGPPVRLASVPNDYSIRG